MKRTLKLAGIADNRDAEPVFTLPSGHYRVVAEDGEIITVRVGTGDAGTSVEIAGWRPMSVEVSNPSMPERIEVRRLSACYYPMNAYSQAFKAWYDTHDGTFPGTRAEWEAAQTQK